MRVRWPFPLLLSAVLLMVDTPTHGQELELVGTIPGPATTVSVHQTRAFVSHGPTLRIFDIAVPTMPTLLGSFTFPQDVRGVAVAGSVAFAAMDFSGLGILDVSNPAIPALLSSYDTPGQALSVAVSRSTSTVAVANRLSGLEVIDVSNPAVPVLRGTYFTEGYAVDVATSGSFAYVTDTPGGLSVIDLSQTGDLAAAGTQGVASPSASVAVSGALVALMGADSQLELFNVSNPSAPVSVGTYRDPERERTAFAGAAATIGLVRVRMQESLAFLTDTYPPFTLQVVDLVNPAAPTLVTSYEPGGAPQDLAVSGSLVFLAVRDVGVGDTDPPPAGVLILRLRP